MKHFVMRQPKKQDAAEIYEMLQPYKPYVGTSPLYTYLLVCEHFNETSIVAENENDEIVGFTSAFFLPKEPNALFLWEIAVKEGYHGNNLYLRMVKEICDQTNPTYIDATVNPSNSSSIKRLKQLANIFNSQYASHTLFPAACFGKQDHEDEVLYRIGPIQ